MISLETVDRWITELGLDDNARAQIRHIMESNPVRAVQGNRSVRGMFRSRKMDCTIQTESTTEEWPLAVTCEYDPDVLAYVDQPCWLTIRRQNGPPCSYTPDFFVLSRTNGAELIECKPEDALRRLADPNDPENQAWRYCRESDGTWRSPPAEEAAGRFGLKFRIVSANGISRTLRRNCDFLAPYLNDQDAPLDQAALQRITDLVTQFPGIRCREIREKLGNDLADTLYHAIARQIVYVDLLAEVISESFEARVFADVQAATLFAHIEAERNSKLVAVHLTPGAKFIYEGQAISLVNFDGTLLTFYADNGQLQTVKQATFEQRIIEGAILPTNDAQTITASTKGAKILHGASRDAQNIALERCRLIERSLARIAAGQRPEPNLTRQQQRYLRAYRQAKATVGIGLVGLLPKQHPGNRKPRVDPRVEEIIRTAIESYYLSKQAPSEERLWNSVCQRCKEHIPPLPYPARKTVSRRIKKQSRHRVTLARFGKRAAYQELPSRMNDADAEMPRFGEHAWDVAHIDHTQADVELKSESGHPLGRPWITIMFAPRFGRFLAYHLSFEPPSHRSCLGVVRDCVSRRHRLPRILVTDNGKEFESNNFDLLLKRFEIHQQFRPPGDPRFGASLERFNEVINTRLLHNLEGNTRLAKSVRLITKSHDPKRLAQWTIAELCSVLEDFLFEYMDTLPHPVTKVSARDAFEQDLRAGGERQHTLIPYDREFFIATLPSTPKGVATIRPRSGITIHGIWYWSSAFRDHKHHGQQVEVRYDPYDISTIYAKLGGEWIECRSRRYYELLRGISEKERQVISAYWRRNAQGREDHRRSSGIKLIDLLIGHEALPAAQIQAVKHQEELAARGLPQNSLTAADSNTTAPKASEPQPSPQALDVPCSAGHLVASPNGRFHRRPRKEYDFKVIDVFDI